MSQFKMDGHSTVDKSFAIYNDEITLVVDYDDVDHKTVERAAKWVLEVLNTALPRSGASRPAGEGKP